MSTATQTAEATPEQEFTLTRVFDAPRDLVWAAWTDLKHLAQWWGPKGFTMEVCNMDLRPGGTFHYGMKAPNGQLMWGKFVYREVTPPERLVLVNSFSDEKGGLTRHPWSANWPLEVLNTTTFTEQDGKTTLSMRGRPINATQEELDTYAAGHESMNKGFAGTMDQLAAYLASL